MHYLTVAFTFIYIILESATAQMSSAVFFRISSLSELKNAEQLGYVTSGIGVALLLNSQIPQRCPKIIRLLAFFVCFFVVSNSLHAFMKEAPQYLPAPLKQQSVLAGVGLMAHPSPLWVSSLYGLNRPPAQIEADHVTMFVLRHGSSDLQNRHLLASGIRGIGIFSHHWDLAVEQLDKKSLTTLFYRTHRGTYEQHFTQVSAARHQSWVWAYQYLSLPVPDEEASHALSKLRNWTAHEASWWALREKFPFLPIAAPEFSDWPTVFNQHFTQHALKNYALKNQSTRMPWRGEERYTELYRQICEEIAPFLFLNGRPALDLSLLREQQTRDLYITELHRTLSPKLQLMMRQYQIDNLILLSKKPQSWNNPVRSAPGDGLVRLMWITPWLTVMSWALLLFNTKNLIHLIMKERVEPIRKLELWLAAVLTVVLMSNATLSSALWQEKLLPIILIAGPAEPNLKII